MFVKVWDCYHNFSTLRKLHVELPKAVAMLTRLAPETCTLVRITSGGDEHPKRENDDADPAHNGTT